MLNPRQDLRAVESRACEESAPVTQFLSACLALFVCSAGCWLFALARPWCHDGGVHDFPAECGAVGRSFRSDCATYVARPSPMTLATCRPASTMEMGPLSSGKGALGRALRRNNAGRRVQIIAEGRRRSQTRTSRRPLFVYLGRPKLKLKLKLESD